MKPTAPKQVTWIVALVLGVLGFLGYLITIPLLTQIAFWLVLVGLALMLVATVVEGL